MDAQNEPTPQAKRPSSSDVSQKLTPAENTLFGLGMGVVDVACTQWMLYLKNATQQRLPLTVNPAILYRGSFMSLTNMCVLYAVQIPVAGIASNIITKGEDRRLTDGEQILAGAIGGVTSGFICAPMELVMIQQQRFGQSLLGTGLGIVKQNGVLGLWRGLPSACGREGLFTAGLLGIGPVLKRYAEDMGYSESQASVIAAVAGGVSVATLSHPLDTIKTCQQGDIAKTHYNGFVHTARTLTGEAGFKRFFSGWTWRTGRTITQIFLLDMCRGLFCPILFPHYYE